MYDAKFENEQYLVRWLRIRFRFAGEHQFTEREYNFHILVHLHNNNMYVV